MSLGSNSLSANVGNMLVNSEKKTRWSEKRSHTPIQTIVSRDRSAIEITYGVCPELLLLQSMVAMRLNSSQIGLNSAGISYYNGFLIQ
jgi:hypothetical protein